MKAIRCWNDLREYGIDLLTGEACGLSYRLLCDVTARGKRTLEKALSIQQLGLAENWNHGSDDDEHVGSIMLAPGLLPVIGIYALLDHGCREVWLTKDGRLIGIEQSDTTAAVDSFMDRHAHSLVRTYTYTGTPSEWNQRLTSGWIH